MFKRFLFLAILILSTSPRDVIAEEPGDIFGFKWKMSYAEASKIASGRMKKIEKSSHFNKSVYALANPKEPSGATHMILSFFNDELYSLSVVFFVKSDYDLKRKARGIVGALESKHRDAEMSDQIIGSLHYWLFDYHNEAGLIENPYSLEMVSVFAASVDSEIKMLTVLYSFYGTKKIDEHIRKLKDEKEFGDF